MTLLLLFSGLGLLGLPACARPLGRRLPPAEWARVCAGLLAAGAIVVEASLAIQAAPTMLRTVGLEDIAEMCEHVAPGGAPVGIAAATAAVVIALLAGRAALGVRRRHRTARVAREIGWHGTLGGHRLVVLPSEELVAFSTAGRPGQVVMSRGLITALSDDELAAVVRTRSPTSGTASAVSAAGTRCGAQSGAAAHGPSGSDRAVLCRRAVGGRSGGGTSLVGPSQRPCRIAAGRRAGRHAGHRRIHSPRDSGRAARGASVHTDWGPGDRTTAAGVPADGLLLLASAGPWTTSSSTSPSLGCWSTCVRLIDLPAGSITWF